MVTEERLLEISRGLAEYIAPMGRPKFIDQDLKDEPDLRDVALEYLAGYSGTLDFMNDLKIKDVNFLSTGQLRGILNVALAQTRERGGRVPPEQVNGLALRGYYKMPNNGPTIVIRKWQDDGTSVVGYEDPITQRVEAFGSVHPGGAEFLIWGKYRSNEAIKLIADDFFTQADTLTREGWGKEYAKLTGKCWICGTETHVEGGSMCERCAEARYAEPGF